jgi:hypothetical protein
LLVGGEVGGIYEVCDVRTFMGRKTNSYPKSMMVYQNSNIKFKGLFLTGKKSKAVSLPSRRQGGEDV